MNARRTKEQTRTDLVQAAFAQLEDQSLDGLSIRQLTSAAGITPAAFYRHFEDIDEIGLVLADEAMQLLTAGVRSAVRSLDDFSHADGHDRTSPARNAFSRPRALQRQDHDTSSDSGRNPNGLDGNR